MEFISAKIPTLASTITADLLDALSSDFPNIARKLDKDLVMASLHDYAVQNFSRSVELSFVRPDYEGIKLQLMAFLQEKPAWKDIITAAGGQTILEYVAAIGAYAQLSIQRALQESMLDTARLKSSIYTITRMLGVHIRRKIPCQTTVTLENTDADKFMQIPKLSQFTVNGVKFFNKEAITFTPQTPTQDVVLYQGEIIIEEVISSGRPFQRWEIGSSDFMVADSDVLCIDSDFLEYRRIEDGLWHYSDDAKVFYENSTPNGNVECLFGNGLHGAIPPINKKLYFVYAKTSGDEHVSSNVGLPVFAININNVVADRIRRATPLLEQTERNRIILAIRGTTITSIDGGSQEQDTEFYRILAPHIHSARGRAVSRKDHYALALDCPEVSIVDVKWQGQQELGRNDRNLINVVGLTTLKKNGTPLTEDEWKRFFNWFEDRSIWRANYLRIDPIEVPLDIEANIYIHPSSDPSRVKTYLQYRLNEAFKIQRGSLGRSVYESDIFEILEAKHHTLKVDYVELNMPNYDYVISPISFVKLRDVQLNVKYSERYTYIPSSVFNTTRI